MVSTRAAVYAGQFYPKEPDRLRRTLSTLLAEGQQGVLPLAALVPHAGYLYSGSCAGSFYGALPAVPPLVLLLGPNHTGRGPAISIAPHRRWETPLGRVPLAQEYAGKLLEALGPLAALDAEAHLEEHSLEVHLPFLQYLSSSFSLLPVTLGPLSYEGIERVTEALYRITDGLEAQQVLLIASTDMSHFVSLETARTLDALALDQALSLDPRGLFEVVQKNRISMCGVVPAAVALLWAKRRGARSASLLNYTHSGEVTGDTSSVVAYASLGFYS